MPKDGSLDYIELPCRNIPASKAFYGAVFGWTFVDYGPEYVAFAFDGRDGGFNAQRKVADTGGPLLVLYANDLDAMETKVRNAGAEIVHRESFEGGRRFHFRDPNGNELAVWTKTQPG
ncbi:MAG TPA: VOC family protein [Rhizomicrobium sp.]|nr:VOC family protein [Rhizomicrobium sp.]